jgi:dephospho-CoA kinase
VRALNAQIDAREQSRPPGGKLCVAIFGLAGAGKSEATNLLCECFEYQPVYMGGVIIDLVKEAGLDVTPENERAVRERLRAEEGPEAVARRCLPAIEEALERSPGAVIDGVYGSGELAVIQGALPRRIVTVALHSSRRVRLQRLADRVRRPLQPQDPRPCA